MLRVREICLRPLEFPNSGRWTRRPTGRSGGMFNPDVPLHSWIGPTRSERLERIEHERQWFEINLNALDRFGGSEFVDCRNGEDRLTLVKRLHRERAFALRIGLDYRAVIGKAVGRRWQVIGRKNR